MNRIIRMKEVVKKVGLSRTTLWRMEKDGLFVSRVRLSVNAVGYLSDQIDAWMASRPIADPVEGKK